MPLLTGIPYRLSHIHPGDLPEAYIGSGQARIDLNQLNKIIRQHHIDPDIPPQTGDQTCRRAGQFHGSIARRVKERHLAAQILEWRSRLD